MSNTKHTPGPWRAYRDPHHETWSVEGAGDTLCDLYYLDEETHRRIPLQEGNEAANARLIAAAPDQHEEMVRHLVILERLEREPELWARMAAGTGIATLNAYRAAIAKATAQ